MTLCGFGQVASSDERNSRAATPRGSVVAVADRVRGTTPGAPILPTAPNTLRGSARTPFASVCRLLLLAEQRPRNSSVPPAGQSKRLDRHRAPSAGVVVGWNRDHRNAWQTPGSAHRPVRKQLGGRAAFRNSSLMLGLCKTPEAVPPANQSRRGREQRRTETSRAQCPSSCVLVAASLGAFVPGVPQVRPAARRHGPEWSHGGGLRAGSRGISRLSR